MNLTTWYDAGTVSVATGSAIVTGFNNFWGDDAIMAGDLFCDPAQPLIPPQRVKSAKLGELELWTGWPGAALVQARYEVRYVGIIERSTAQTRKVLEELGQVSAWYDIMVEDNTARLALETANSPLRANYRVLVKNAGVIWAKKSGAFGDWIGPVEFRGPIGDRGPTGPAGVVWRGAYAAPTVYAINDGVTLNGSSFRKRTNAAAGTAPSSALPPVSTADWELLASRGANGDIGGVTSFWANRLLSDANGLAARAGLELVKQTSETDTTAGALLINGAHGLGGFVSLASPNLLDTRPTGFYYASSPTGGPAGNGWLRVQSLSNDYQYQEFVAVPGGQKWSNFKDNGVWQGWKAETSAGSVINSWYGAYSLYYNGAAPIAVDDTAPLITSGVQLVSIVTGPLRSSTSKLRMRYSGLVGSETIGAAVLSVHVNGNAAARTSYGVIRTPGDSLFMGGEFEFSPGSGASLTVSLRAAAQTGNLRLNGLTSRLFGGALGHTLVVEEIRA